MLDNAGTQMGTEMLDTQFATKMTGLPGGLSEVIARQLERQMGGAPPARCRRRRASAAAPQRPRRSQAMPQRRPASCSSTASAARAAEAATGIPAAFMVAQAAHEIGLGPARDPQRRRQRVEQPVRHQGRRRLEGRGRRGDDHRVRRRPAAQGDGEVPRLRVSYAESFADYARLMKNSPRYAGVLASGGSAAGLRRRACSGRLRHRPGLRRQAGPRRSTPRCACSARVT